MIDERAVMLVGGPDAGKTNYLCRLWLAICDEISALHKTDLPNDLSYLQSGLDHILEGRFAPHTSREVHVQNVIPVKYRKGDEEFSGKLIVPDCSGERWLAIYEQRKWSDEWEQLITEQCGCLVFVRAGSDQIVTPLDWINCQDLYDSAALLTEEIEEGGATPTAPTQVVLTEWLQFLRQAFTERVGGEFRPRIGIVVSAWDCVPQDQQSAGPENYIAENFPMFGQFLESNAHCFDIASFGVSVVGGDLKSEPKFRDTFLNGEPHKSGYVIHNLSGAISESPDICLPVAWAMGFNVAGPKSM